MNMHTCILSDTERILKEVLDYPDLVLDALAGDSAALRYLHEEIKRLQNEGNTHVADILTRLIGEKGA